MVAEEEREIPAPPCKFRCNRSRMMLTIRVTLHHVGADHINLKTSRKKIVLDTLKSRRKFKLSRAYPRGIECDDSQTSAKLERGALVVEMPITKLPSITTDQQPAASASGGSSSTKAEKRKKSAAPEADGPAAKKRKAPIEPPAHEDEEDEEDDDDFMRGDDDDDDGDEEEEAPRGKANKGKKAKPTSDPSDARMRELLNEATDAAAQKRDASLSKMRKLQAAEDEKKRKVDAKQQERVAQKKKLLESFQRQRAALKAEKAQAKATASVAAKKKADSSPKRVSFSPGT